MAGADAAFGAMQAAADLHQAAAVAGDYELRSAGLRAFAFVGQHRGGNVGELDREQAAEPAAFGASGQLAQLEAFYVFEQFARLIDDAQLAQQMTRRMVSHRMRK